MNHASKRFDPAKWQRLVSAERFALLPPELVLRHAHIRSGDAVADIGAGPGYFTVPLAERVGADGAVYAMDVAPEMIELLRSRALPPVVRVIPMDGEAIPLRGATLDAALLAFVLHEIDEPGAFLREVLRTLKPAGRLLVVEWLRQVEEAGPPLQERLAPQDTTALLEQSGYKIEAQRILNSSHYLVSAQPRAHTQSS